MRLIYNIKPSKFVGNCKETLLSKANLMGWSIDSAGSHYMSGNNDEYVYVINMTKVRRKTKQKQFINNNGFNETKAIIVRESHWIGFRYRIPVAILKALELKVEQGKRTFKLVKKK